MACEYQESDVFFSNQPAGEGSASSCYILPPQPRKNSADRRSNTNKKTKKLRGNNSTSITGTDTATAIPSSPICIPETNHFRLRNELIKGWEGGGGEVVPPHLIVARRVAGMAEFSVCSGRGRTLKGRDLKEVRDGILRMTGFLEA